MRLFDGWASFGLGTIVTAYPVALSTTRALVNFRVPAHCRIESIEARLAAIAGGPATATLTIWRDSAPEDELFVEGIAGTIVLGATAGRGGTAWPVGRDHHPDGANSTVGQRIDWPQNQYVDLYAGIVLNAGTANLTALVVNWKG